MASQQQQSTASPTDQRTDFDRWRDKVRRFADGLDVQSRKKDLKGEISTFNFAGASLWSISSGPQLIRRACASPGGVFGPTALIQLSGQMSIAQDSQRCELASGDFAFIDTASPHEIEYAGDFQILALHFPANTFRRAVYGHALGKPMNSLHPANAPFHQCVLNIWRAGSAIHPLRHSSALAALISLSHMTTAMNAAENMPDYPVRVLWAMDFIEKHLGDADLCPQKVADAQKVSRRYLDEMFAALGHRVQTWIWERRLLRAADDLRFNTEWKHTILQAALDHGFKTPSHFTRAFAKRFGMPPRVYRQKFGIVSHNVA